MTLWREYWKYKKKPSYTKLEGVMEKMIKVLFVCHGSILRCPEKAYKINVSTAESGVYYTTTTPFFERVLK